jgi:hypothetical protein
MVNKMHDTCQFKKADSSFCKRPVGGAKERFCWQHASGLIRKWRSLTRNQSTVFVVSILALVIGIPSAYWSYRGSRKRDANKSSTTVVQSSGDDSPNVVGNSGDVTVNTSDPKKTKRETGEKSKP